MVKVRVLNQRGENGGGGTATQHIDGAVERFYMHVALRMETR